MKAEVKETIVNMANTHFHIFFRPHIDMCQLVLCGAVAPAESSFTRTAMKLFGATVHKVMLG